MSKRVNFLLATVLVSGIGYIELKGPANELERQRSIVREGHREGINGKACIPPPYDTEDRNLWIEGYRAGEITLFEESRENPPKTRTKMLWE